MVKSIWLILFSLIIVHNVHSQCEIQEGLPLDNALIYPLPFGVFTPEEGGLGFNKEAVVGSEFDFTWTMIWPDSFLNPITNELAYADTVQFFLDQTIWVLEGDTVGIPEGLVWNITPENGTSLPSDSIPVFCINLSGTPSDNVTPGEYLMTFSVRTCLNIPGLFDGCQDALIPSIFSGFPGEYRLNIKESGSTSVKETLNNSVGLKVAPNPFSQKTFIEFDGSKLSSDYSFSVYDLNGKVVQSRSLNLKSGNQRILFDGSRLINGVYVFQIKGREGLISERVVIQR